MFVNTDDPIRRWLIVGFNEKFFPFKHYSENVARIFGELFIFLNQSTQQVFGAFVGDFHLLLFDGCAINTAPEGKWFVFVVSAVFPSFGAKVLSEISARFRVGKECGVEGFSV